MGRKRLSFRDKRVAASFTGSIELMKEIERLNRLDFNVSHSRAVEILVRKGIAAHMGFRRYEEVSND